MEIGRLIKRVLVSLAILFFIFQPVMVPVVYAVESWTGNPWDGNPWEGDPWDGSDLQWEGKSWTGNPWEGKDWTGKGTDGTGTEGQSWNGYDWESVPWYLKGWSQPGFEGSKWNRPAWVGNGSTGSPWLNPGWQGLSSQGNPWRMPGWSGYGSQGNHWSNPTWNGQYGQGNPWLANGYIGYGTMANPWEIPGWAGFGTDTDGDGSFPQIPHFYDGYGFQIGEYVVKDVINGQAGFINSAIKYQDALANGEDVKFGLGNTRRMFGDMIINGMKLGVGSNFVTDSYDTATHVEDGVNAVNDFKAARNLMEATQTASNTLETADELSDATRGTLSNLTSASGKMGALSKLNVGVAALGTGVSAVKTYNSIGDAVDTFNNDSTGAEKTSAVADVGANVGDTLMNAGVVASAIPGGQVIGAGMVAAGAGLWVVSKGVKLFANNWKGDLLTTTKEIGKKAADGIKKGWNKVKGWFS